MVEMDAGHIYSMEPWIMRPEIVVPFCLRPSREGLLLSLFFMEEGTKTRRFAQNLTAKISRTERQSWDSNTGGLVPAPSFLSLMLHCFSSLMPSGMFKMSLEDFK